DPGEAHPADGREEELGLLLGRELARTSRRDEAQPAHVGREAPVAVVVLAVHVGCHRAAEADVAGAWCHGSEPTLWDAVAKQRVEGQAGLGAYDPARLVEL